MRGATVERRRDGGLIVSAIIQDGRAGGAWRFHREYYGYTVTEARQLFREELKNRNYQLERGY